MQTNKQIHKDMQKFAIVTMVNVPRKMRVTLTDTNTEIIVLNLYYFVVNKCLRLAQLEYKTNWHLNSIASPLYIQQLQPPACPVPLSPHRTLQPWRQPSPPRSLQPQNVSLNVGSSSGLEFGGPLSSITSTLSLGIFWPKSLHALKLTEQEDIQRDRIFSSFAALAKRALSPKGQSLISNFRRLSHPDSTPERESRLKSLQCCTMAPKPVSRGSRNIDRPALGGYGGESISSEPLAKRKDEDLEVLKGPSDELQALVVDDHSLEPNLLEPRIRAGHGDNPGVDKSAPVLGNQIEVREMRLPLELQRSDLRETADHDARAHGVAVSDEYPPPAPPLDLEPRLAHQRHRVPVLVGAQKREHVLQHFLRKRVRHCTVQRWDS
nr:hypothetical protein BHM03_00061492 [Ipomoea batatas]